MLRKYQSAVFATLSATLSATPATTRTFSTKRSTSPALPVRRVRELLRPFILAVHPDRYHGPENQEIKRLNEDSLKRLNGFFDMAETKSTMSRQGGRSLGTVCEALYTFEFKTTATPTKPLSPTSPTLPTSSPMSPMSPSSPSSPSSPPPTTTTTAVPIQVVVNVPLALRAHSPPNEAIRWEQHWLHVVSKCAVGLFQKASMKVPDELHALKQHSSVSKRSKKKQTTSLASGRSSTPQEDAQDAEWVRRKTMELIKQYSDSFEMIGLEENSTSSDGGQEKEEDVLSVADMAQQSQQELNNLQASVVNQLFQSQRVSVTAKKQVSPTQVMGAADILKRLLLQHYELLQFGQPEWSSVMFLLNDQKEAQYQLIQSEEEEELLVGWQSGARWPNRENRRGGAFVSIPIVALVMGGKEEEEDLLDVLMGLTVELLGSEEEE
jgi:hypothetical protein